MITCSAVQAEEKAKAPAKAAEVAEAQESTVVHSFVTEDEVKQFVGLFNTKEANINRLNVLQAYLKAERSNIDQLNAQLLEKYKIKKDQQYTLDTEKKVLVLAAKDDAKQAK